MEKVQETHLYKCLKERDSKFISQLDEVIKYAETMLPLINNVFASYTIHGIQHSIDIMEYMYQLINNVDQLSELELVALIYSALLHDIGMIAKNDEIKEIKSDTNIVGKRKYSKVFERYQDEEIALQECIRPEHGIRAERYIKSEMKDELFLIPETTHVSFKSEVALICRAHNEDFEWIKKELKSSMKKGTFDLNAQYIAVLLRISDYLDIDEQRAPLYLYKFLAPKEFGDLEWRQHFMIDNYDKIRKNPKTKELEIFFQGTSQDPTIHRKLLKYFDSINAELRNAVDLCESFPEEKYLLTLKTTVINQIQTNGFSFSDLRLSLEYNAVTNLLMGENIYGNKKYGLRELIQNSIDACKTMQESALSMEKYRYKTYQPEISVVLDKDRKKVMIIDNGSGMSIDILKKYFLNVGVSYYMSDDYKLQDRKYSPIGHYGIGFLACFMLSDKVEVNTVYYNELKMNHISFERNSEYICLTCEETVKEQGTEIVLDYDSFFAVFDRDIRQVVSFIKENFLDCGIPIRLLTIESGISNCRECEMEKGSEIIPGSICLSPYLNGIDVYVYCNCQHINFAKYLSDINGYDTYYYDEKNHSITQKIIPIKKCVKNGKIKFWSIPIISNDDEEEFLTAYDVLGDYEDALDRIEYEMINIWSAGILPQKGLLTEPEETIIGEYTVNDLIKQFDYSDEAPVSINVIEQDVVTGNSDMVLPYLKRGRFTDPYGWGKRGICYIKNVLLSELNIIIPYLIDGLILREMVVNILNPQFVPNVARNNISGEQQEQLSYAIGKALHLWIRDHVELSDRQKDLLDEFIRIKYGETNFCLK